MSKLGKKLFIIIMSTALCGLIIISIFVNFSINRQFTGYIYLENKEIVNELVSSLKENYRKYNDWRNIDNVIRNFKNTKNLKFFIADINGDIIAYSHTGIIRGQNINRGETESINLIINNKNIGKLHWFIPLRGNYTSEHAEHFVDRLNKVIFLTSAVIALITIVISFFLSRHLTEPLLKMNVFAGKVAEGDFKQELKIKGTDEIAELADSFSEMINKLAHLEKIRKESTSDLAHELRTPVTTIKSYIEGIEDGILAVDKKTIKDVKEETERLILLINRLQELTETEEKILHLKKEKQNLSQIIKNIVARYKIKTLKKSIRLEENYPGEDIYIAGDKDSLYTILNNLLSNALKYTKKNGLIKISLKTTGNNAVIKLIDTGIGIPESDLPFIFERFYRTDKSRSANSGGVGIGLTITKNLVEAHAGKIKVKSSNKGTEFIIYFPLY